MGLKAFLKKSAKGGSYSPRDDPPSPHLDDSSETEYELTFAKHFDELTYDELIQQRVFLEKHANLFLLLHAERMREEKKKLYVQETFDFLCSPVQDFANLKEFVTRYPFL